MLNTRPCRCEGGAPRCHHSVRHGGCVDGPSTPSAPGILPWSCPRLMQPLTEEIPPLISSSQEVLPCWDTFLPFSAPAIPLNSWFFPHLPQVSIGLGSCPLAHTLAVGGASQHGWTCCGRGECPGQVGVQGSHFHLLCSGWPTTGAELPGFHPQKPPCLSLLCPLKSP